MRLVAHQYTQGDLETLKNNTDGVLVTNAIGYLSTWALDSYDYAECIISISSDHTEMTACYRLPDSPRAPPKFVLGAVWHDGHFGFHS